MYAEKAPKLQLPNIYDQFGRYRTDLRRPDCSVLCVGYVRALFMGGREAGVVLTPEEDTDDSLPPSLRYGQDAAQRHVRGYPGAKLYRKVARARHT